MVTKKSVASCYTFLNVDILSIDRHLPKSELPEFIGGANN